MSQAETEAHAPDHTSAGGVVGGSESEPIGVTSAGVLLAGLTAAAGIIHVAMVPIHAGGSLVDPVGFALAAWAQLWIAATLITGKAGKRTVAASLLVNAALSAAWLWSRTLGLPWGSHAGVKEAIAGIDAMTVGLQLAAILAGAYALLVPQRERGFRLAPALAAVAALGLATAGIASPDAATHGHSAATGVVAAGATSADGHNHGATAGSAASADQIRAELATIDKNRCDQALNPVAYWDEARYLGVDIYGGGAITPPTATDSTSPTAIVGATDAFGGRGSDELDSLVTMTGEAGTSEGAAARLVVKLSESSNPTYVAWLGWLKQYQSVGHSHTSGSGDDTGGHGGHVGPQPWKAMVDQSECATLEKELDRAKAVALKYPTTEDAVKAGWFKVTGYVPGIAAHYMNFGMVDGTFNIDEPEMLLYDGDQPDSQIIGLSYYLLHPGDAEPTQGFTGGNDHFHRHIGLCIKGGVVVSDSTVSEADCAALGGVKQGGGAGWMNHVWIVPGCESPWGVFSAASPILDKDLVKATATEGSKGCAKSGVRDRYDLTPGSAATLARPTQISVADA